MAINLLGSHDESETKKSQPAVEKYIPPDEKKKESKKEEPKPEPKKEEDVPAAPAAFDLSEGLKRRKAIMTSVFAVIGVFILAAAGYAGYYVAVQQGFFKQAEVPLPAPSAPVNNTNTVPAVTNTAPVTPPVTQPSSNAPLPDTPLAPLKGAIIRFPNSSDLYLIETNGELRLVVPQTVTFKNGQKISDLNPNLIYTLPLKWQDTRKGAKIVQGQVDFDPRVLSLSELLPFLQ